MGLYGREAKIKRRTRLAAHVSRGAAVTAGRWRQGAFKYHTGFVPPPQKHALKSSHFTFGLKRSAVGIALLLLLAACASESTLRNYVPQIVTPYRMDIQQGNFITADMVTKLAVGQTREQVRFILGTPLLADVFHANRWDYIFRFSKGWKEPEKRKLVIFFDAANRVERWEADVPAPSAAGAAPPDAAAPPPPKPQVLPDVPAAVDGASGPASTPLDARQRQMVDSR